MRTFVVAVKIILALALFPPFWIFSWVLVLVLALPLNNLGKQAYLHWQAPILKNLDRERSAQPLSSAQLNLACNGVLAGYIRLVETTSLTRRAQSLHPTGTPASVVRESYLHQGFEDIDSSRQSMSAKLLLQHFTHAEIWVYRITWKAAEDGAITQIDGCVLRNVID